MYSITGRGITYTTTALPAWDAINMNISSSGLDAGEVNQFLIDFEDGSGTAGSINIKGDNGTRTAASDAAVTALRAAPQIWVITVNE